MNDRNGGLQVGRAVACIGVVVGHSAYMSSVLTDTPAPAWLMREGSAFGVYLFFVLSGYVMGMILGKESPPSAAWFLWHRALRIYPAYWAAASLFCILCYTVLYRPVPPFDPAALVLSPVIFGNSTYSVPAWTLVYEMVFYLLIAALLAYGATRRQITITAVAWMTLIVAFHLVFGQTYWHAEPGVLILFSPINLFFIAGLAVSIYQIKLTKLPTLPLLTAALALWLLANMFEPVKERLIPTLFQAPACVLCVIAFARLEPTNLAGRAAVSLGNASYGIYLIHMIVLDTLFTVTRAHNWHPQMWIAFAVMLAAGLAAGWAFGLVEFSVYRLTSSAASGARLRQRSA